MATLYERAMLAKHPGFRERVTMRAVLTAQYINGEGESGDTRRDNLRKTLATNVLNNPDEYTNRFAWAAVTNDEVANGGLAFTDDALEFVVSFMWDAIAGV